MSETKIAKYQIVESDIIDKINNGIFKAEQALPTENQLAEIYDCSRVTVRQALSNLAYRGYIKKVQGSGSYVNKSTAIQRTPFLESFTHDMQKQGKVPTTKIMSFSIVEASNTFSRILGIAPHDQIFYIERLRCADGVAVLYEKTFMSCALHQNISYKVLESSKYAYAEANGLHIDHAIQNVAPIFAPRFIANELKLSETTPIIRINNTTFLSDGRVFDFTELYLHPELYQLNFYKENIKFKDENDTEIE